MRPSQYNVWVEREEADYVFNGVSGALLRMPRGQRQAMEALIGGDVGAACSTKLLEELVRGRMLVGDGMDELAMLGERYRASREETAHFGLTLVTSLGCNFDCPYCFEAKHPSIMDDHVQRAVLQILDDQLPTIGSFSVSWYGGEPLVGKRALLSLSDAFIQRCDRAGVAYSAQIVTNGYLLTEETCMELRDRRVTHAQVTLDGPPEVHDRMRPLVGGGGTFWQIVQNLRHAVEYVPVTVRVNVDTTNFDRAEELFQILVTEGLAGKLDVYPGQLVDTSENLLAPSASYQPPCFTNPEFAWAERRFFKTAQRYGLAAAVLPRATGAPCTAVRANELVVGSAGELYKCWESVGDKRQVIGDIRDYRNTNGRLHKWLAYDPFSNDECRSCLALPVCMGGCAHHAFDALQYENRCGTFRTAYREQVLDFVEAADESRTGRLVVAPALGRRMETR